MVQVVGWFGFGASDLENPLLFGDDFCDNNHSAAAATPSSGSVHQYIVGYFSELPVVVYY